MNEIIIKNKTEVILSGVKKLIEITPKKAVFDIDNTTLTILGNNLELASINESQTDIVIKGEILNLNLGLIKKTKESFVKKLFQ